MFLNYSEPRKSFDDFLLYISENGVIAIEEFLNPFNNRYNNRKEVCVSAIEKLNNYLESFISRRIVFSTSKNQSNFSTDYTQIEVDNLRKGEKESLS